MNNKDLEKSVVGMCFSITEKKKYLEEKGTSKNCYCALYHQIIA